ncbi:asparaginase [Alteriqipengyuania flavescens]|uniref:asparaginase n=1 Tax=Alteriqipengyuania flavescens TaxID=3053610 RepID=UPI0025B333F0|nr:asparaginase [Alteriqipengyuania flavescens]WJY17874.1 asparaginase [Alteriqipengyuania flavescens]WJY23815.1 asparaginase [Alteriqipengyuania flavescens]
MTPPRILVLATGGTIAGQAGSATRADYRPGQIEIGSFLDMAGPLGLEARLEGRQVAAIGSEDITPDIWRALHTACAEAMDDPAVGGIVITHGTDTAEETALLLDLTLPATKPVVLVGAMRPADAVGSDGLRNFANAVRVAGDADAAGRGVLLVMSDRVIAARDARKARTGGTDAFRGYPRDAVAAVTPSSLEWFGAPWRSGEAARFDFPETWPTVPILYARACMEADAVDHVLSRNPAGMVMAGFGAGTMPQGVRRALAKAAARGVIVVRSSRVGEGLVDREPADDTDGFVAARALGPAKSRILLQVLLANGLSEPADVQAAFDHR